MLTGKIRFLSGGGAALAACVALGALALGFAALKVYEWTRRPGVIAVDPATAPFWGPNGLNSYFMYMVNAYDSAGQRRAVRVALLALAPAVLFAPALRRLLPLLDSPSRRRAAWGLVACAALFAYNTCLKRNGLSLTSGRVLRMDFVGFSVALALAVVAGYTRRGAINRAIWGAVLALVAAADLPGFVTELDLSGYSDLSLSFVEHHFSVTLGQAERLAAGHRLVDLVIPRYGVLLQLALAAFQLHVRPLTMGQTILVLQCLQFLYLVLCVIVLSRQCRGNGLLCLLAGLLVIPWYLFFTQASLYPNQSAWRTLGFPLALLSIRTAYRWPLARSSLALGFLAGCLLLLNPETGIAATAGLLASLLYRTRFFAAEGRLRDLPRLAPFVPGLIAPCLLFAAAWFLALGHWPDPHVVGEIVDRIIFWSSSGFAGLAYPGHFVPLALFAWSAFFLVYAALAGGARACPAHGVRAGAAAISLVWLPYYANRSDYWNLSSFGILYAIPAIDATRCLMVGVRLRRVSNINPSTITALALTAFVTIPGIRENIYYCSTKVCNFRVKDEFRATAPRSARGPGTVELSGVILDEELARDVEQKARALARSRRDGPVIYLTLHSYLIPKLSGISSRIPVGDLLAECLNKNDYDRLIGHIEASGAREIYVDPSGLVPGPRDRNLVLQRSGAVVLGPSLDFFQRLLRDLRGVYHADRSADGWEIWVRTDGGTGVTPAGRRAAPPAAQAR
jgi:hypothetical protein